MCGIHERTYWPTKEDSALPIPTSPFTRLKTIWSSIAPGFAFLVAALKDWGFGSK